MIPGTSGVILKISFEILSARILLEKVISIVFTLYGSFFIPRSKLAEET
jgi:hypothetical protein